MVLWHPSLLAHSSTILTTTLLPVQGLPEPLYAGPVHFTR
jgi:hypothetical protein